LLAEGSVRCWGNDELGQLGDGTMGIGSRSATPRVVLASDGKAQLSNVVQISAGYTHNCALIHDGTAYCWGDGRYGQRGQVTSSATRSALPLAVLSTSGSPVSGIVDIRAGWEFTCLLMDDQGVKCLGNDKQGERCDGISGEANYGPSPVAVVDHANGPVGGLLQVAPGYHSTCFRNRLSGALCGGANLATPRFGSSISIASGIRW
jgi:alpha-tubulin suppressor-like RCC1 family protein